MIYGIRRKCGYGGRDAADDDQLQCYEWEWWFESVGTVSNNHFCFGFLVYFSTLSTKEKIIFNVCSSVFLDHLQVRKKLFFNFFYKKYLFHSKKMIFMWLNKMTHLKHQYTRQSDFSLTQQGCCSLIVLFIISMYFWILGMRAYFFLLYTVCTLSSPRKKTYLSHTSWYIQTFHF